MWFSWASRFAHVGYVEIAARGFIVDRQRVVIPVDEQVARRVLWRRVPHRRVSSQGN